MLWYSFFFFLVDIINECVYAVNLLSNHTVLKEEGTWEFSDELDIVFLNNSLV